MGFDALIRKVNTSMMGKFANCTVLVTLDGVHEADFPGIFDERGETVTPYEADRTVFHPVVTVEIGNLNGIGSAHVFGINGKQYKFDGKPHPDGEGFTVVHLAEKK